MTLLLATPVRAAELSTATVSLGYAEFRERLVRLMPDYRSLSGSITFSLDVVRARNRIAGYVLSRPEFADVTHVLWVDDDQWPEDIAIVTEMIEYCRGVLGAPYTTKHQPLRWTHQVSGDGRSVMLGFGFTMTLTSVLRGLSKKAEWYTDLYTDFQTRVRSKALVPNLFGQLYERIGDDDETLLSEDYSFCKRAHEAGYSVQLYEQSPGLILHSGGHAWSGRDMDPSSDG